jgi:hypothetical protein
MIFTGEPGKIWDAKRGAVLCRFGVTGVLNVEDPYVIKRLRELGYEEASQDQMVALNICNGVNVDWKEQYNMLDSKYKALKSAYQALEDKLKDIEASIQIPVSPKQTMEEVEQDYIANYYDLNGYHLPKDFEQTYRVAMMKSVLTRFMNYDGDLRKMTKLECIKYMYKFLTENGYIK